MSRTASDFPEKDWKYFSKIRPIAVDRHFKRLVDELKEELNAPDKTDKMRFILVHKLINDRNMEIDDIFDFPRRSTAFGVLISLRRFELITDEEFAGFTEETRDNVNRIVSKP